MSLSEGKIIEGVLKKEDEDYYKLLKKEEEDKDHGNITNNGFRVGNSIYRRSTLSGPYILLRRVMSQDPCPNWNQDFLCEALTHSCNKFKLRLPNGWIVVNTDGVCSFLFEGDIAFEFEVAARLHQNTLRLRESEELKLINSRKRSQKRSLAIFTIKMFLILLLIAIHVARFICE